MGNTISRKQAEAVLTELKDRFSKAGWLVDRANLRDHNHEGLLPGRWSIDWEGQGSICPEDWAIDYQTEVPGVLTWAIMPFVLGICPA
jgi:hypothetical protein